MFLDHSSSEITVQLPDPRDGPRHLEQHAHPLTLAFISLSGADTLLPVHLCWFDGALSPPFEGDYFPFVPLG